MFTDASTQRLRFRFSHRDKTTSRGQNCASGMGYLTEDNLVESKQKEFAIFRYLHKNSTDTRVLRAYLSISISSIILNMFVYSRKHGDVENWVHIYP